MEDVLKHLAHKERHVSDLASFLKNKCENTPNYTLLLGSGCSVTSGISTGANLVTGPGGRVPVSRIIGVSNNQ